MIKVFKLRKMMSILLAFVLILGSTTAVAAYDAADEDMGYIYEDYDVEYFTEEWISTDDEEILEVEDEYLILPPVPMAVSGSGEFLFTSGGVTIDGLNARSTNTTRSYARSIERKQSGRWYAEIHYNSVSGNTRVGIVRNDGNISTSSNIYYSLNYRVIYQRLPAGTPATTVLNQRLNITAGTTIGLAVDADTGTVDFFRDGEFVLTFTFPTYNQGIDYLELNKQTGTSPNGSFDVNFALEAQDFRFPIPEGFQPWLGSSEPPQPDPSELSVALYIGETVQLSVTSNLSDNIGLIWSSNDPSIASIDSQGRVTGISSGITLVSARNPDGSFIEYISVIVFNSDFEPDFRLALHLNSGESRRLFLNSNLEQIQWTSMGTSVVTVDNQGRVTGVANGLAIVQATYQGNTYLIYVRVG